MNWRVALLLTTTLAVVVATLLADPVAQDPAYHDFADNRTMLGTANFLNVASNLAFLFVGVFGITTIARMDEGNLKHLKSVWLMLFIGLVATAIGSSWYHLDPSNETLAWDRLGMVIGFMSLNALVIGEYVSQKAARSLLWPLLVLGIASVLYWSYTESLGRGDLRPYALVQFLPILLIPLTLLLFPARSDLTRWIWWVMVFYAFSKGAELLDDRVFAEGQLLSGHTLKHLLAALASAGLLIGIRRRCA